VWPPEAFNTPEGRVFLCFFLRREIRGPLPSGGEEGRLGKSKAPHSLKLFRRRHFSPPVIPRELSPSLLLTTEAREGSWRKVCPPLFPRGEDGALFWEGDALL